MKNLCQKHDGKHEWHDCLDNFRNKKQSKNKKKKDKNKQNQINKESNYSESSSGKDYNLSNNKSEEKTSAKSELLSSEILVGFPGTKSVFIRQ
eukprot:8171188-Ditylum_brightwellii.AAC.1